MNDDDKTLRDGPVQRLVWGADTAGRRRGEQFYDQLDDTDRISFDVLFDRMAATGRITNDTKFKNEGKGLWVFKIPRKRLACFYAGHALVLIDGFTKKTDRDSRSARNLKTARELKTAYLNAKKTS